LEGGLKHGRQDAVEIEFPISKKTYSFRVWKTDLQKLFSTNFLVQDALLHSQGLEDLKMVTVTSNKQLMSSGLLALDDLQMTSIFRLCYRLLCDGAERRGRSTHCHG
jgi:hypothetical protein